MAGLTKKLKDVLARAGTWPPELQDEAALTLTTLEERGTGVYHVSDEEWADMQEGLAQADRREFVADEILAKADKRLGR